MARLALTRKVAALALSLIVVFQPVPVAAQTPLFEVEKNDATKLLQVNADAGFVVRGTLDAGTIPATGDGARLMWYPKKAAFRAGVAEGAGWDDPNIGLGSVALGFRNTAPGDASTAIGAGNSATGSFSLAGGSGARASGQSAVALGNNPIASGFYALAVGTGVIASGNGAVATGNSTTASANAAVAMGTSTEASGHSSTATGFASKALGFASTATGDHTTAAGDGSVALGSYVAAGTGSFIFGDRSTTDVQSTTDNQFIVRAYGGIGFNSAPNIGCDLNPGSGAWACTSSRLAKEGFQDVDGEAVLTKLAGIRIQSWRYIGTTALHVGPTAEDFRSAFGLGETSIKIGTVDAEGIALRAVQALERRTADLRAENTELRADLAALRAELVALRDGLHISADSRP